MLAPGSCRTAVSRVACVPPPAWAAVEPPRARPGEREGSGRVEPLDTFLESDFRYGPDATAPMRMARVADPSRGAPLCATTGHTGLAAGSPL